MCDPTAILLPRDILVSVLSPSQKMGHVNGPTDSYPFTATNLSRLDNDEYLNDEVVNAYMSLPAIRSLRQLDKPCTFSHAMRERRR